VIQKRTSIRFFLILAVFIVIAGSIQAAPSAADDAQITGDTVHGWFTEIQKNASGKLKALSYVQREFLYDSAANHKIADVSQLYKYDPQGIIGFCFGRAMTVHLIALRMGLKPESIRKLFIVGALKEHGQILWRFHVTTLVLGDDNTWYAIDPIVGNPLAIQHWMKRMRSIYDKQAEAKFYIVPTSAVLPDLRVVPEMEKETGEHLIEVSFAPDGKTGITPKTGLESRTYEASNEASQAFFADVFTAGAGKFDFLSITINGNNISYNNYFVDLLTAIRTAPESEFQAPAMTVASLVATRKASSGSKPGTSSLSARGKKSKPLPANVMSFRFDLIDKAVKDKTNR